MKKFTLDSIVRDYLIESGAESGSDKRYPRYLQLAINGLRHISQAKQTYTKSIVVDVSDNDLIYLPDDYIDYRQIAVCAGGQLWALGRNDNLCNPSTNDCGTLKSPNVGELTNVYDGVFYGNGNLSPGFDSPNAFGEGGGANGIGYYKIFPDRGYISVSLNSSEFGDSYGEVILDYEADIQRDSVTGEFQVHPFDVEPLKDYIYWASMRRLRSYSANDKEMAKRQFHASLLTAQKQKTKLNIREIASAFSRGTFTATKS